MATAYLRINISTHRYIIHFQADFGGWGLSIALSPPIPNPITRNPALNAHQLLVKKVNKCPRNVHGKSTAGIIVAAVVVDSHKPRSLNMKSRIARALVAALVAGTLIFAGTAGLGPPGSGIIVSSVNW